ncbi:MAG: L-fucose/L-arabinose isomerase family protein [Lentisphaerae bacterium]|jgi:L-fucose isomerase-like protein|nr:L-fucose/L-arabinose isomerase family protein [Lentisphaerota bacterium]MBT4815981.1 L-fucose/L-arabinose isomerase family protein [Lentisphaerota bacterium]MBT5607322.1 L-fucose/L-arabinose isomerase family protein [Lentisphaerota bacterium]MBT7055360.1 L-fucose/L-arabinose isomerase family protein [Lentisphaerota bacterium]MBT7844556.1 L-fucose/L-arabinose isomerase family protein [Lentisphaerota bacterium]
MNQLRVGYAPQAKLSWINDTLEDTRRRSIAALEALGVELVAGPLLTDDADAEDLAAEFRRQDVDVMVVHYLTFSLGSMTPLLAQRVGVPVIFWGMPEPPFDGGRIKSNSFCAVNMNCHALRKLGHPYSFVYGTPETIADDMARQFRVAACIKRLRTTRIGMVGSRVPGFYTSCFNELALRRELGVEVKYIDLLEIVDAADKLSPEEADRACTHITAGAGACTGVPEEQLRKGARLYGAFIALKDKLGLDGFAVKCWPQIGDIYGIGVCSTLGQLTDEGIVAACEGDVYGAVAMVMLQELSGTAPFYCDLIAFEEEENVGLGWHCGAAPVSLCARGCCSSLGLHSVMDGGNVKGITHDFPLRGGPVTFTQLGEDIDGSYRFLIASGEGLETTQMLPGNPLRIRFDTPLQTLTETIIDGGFSHHYTVGFADIQAEIKLLCKWLNITPVVV